MELSILLFWKILGMAVMILMGYAVRKREAARHEHLTILSVLLMYVFMPCLIINAFLLGYSTERLLILLVSFVAGFAIQLLMVLLGVLAGKSPFRANGTEQACIAFTNCGNLLVPIINNLLGPEYVFMSMGLLVGNVIFGWMLIPLLVSGKFDFQIDKVVRNPGLLAMIPGFLIFVLRIRLPEFLLTPISSIANAIGVMSMLLTGMVMADIDIGAAFRSVRNLELSMIRLIIVPLIFVLFFALTGLTRFSDSLRDVLLVIFMGVAAPTGTIAVTMTNLYGGDSGLASAVSSMTTLLCIITLPLMVFVFQVLC